MEFDKIANLDPEELVAQERQAAEQLFRLRFQMRLGQNEGLKKLRELKKDVARIKTVERQRELGIGAPAATAGAAETRKAAKSKPSKGRTKAKAAVKSRGAKTAKRSTRTGASAKRGATSRAHTPKRGRANAKKGS